MTRGSDDVVIRRRIPAARADVFRAWTDADGMASWMCPGDVVSADVHLDARVGGALRIVMRTASKAFEHWGEFTVVDPPSKLAFTWRASATGFEASLVTVEFLDAGDLQCDLILTHQKLERSDVRAQYRGGWDQILSRLTAYLRSG